MQKSPDAFRTISEVAEDLDLPQHVLRFWETRFPQIRPLKRAGGRRFYRPADILLLRSIRQLLYDDGYTIKGVQRLLKDQGLKSLRRGEAAELDNAFEAGESASRESVDADSCLATVQHNGDPTAAEAQGHGGVADGVHAEGGVCKTSACAAALTIDGLTQQQPCDPPERNRDALIEALAIIEECAHLLRAARRRPS